MRINLPTSSTLLRAALYLGSITYITLIIIYLVGCTAPARQEVTGAHASITQRLTEPVLNEEGDLVYDSRGIALYRTTDVTGETTGASAKAAGTDAKLDVTGTPPELQLPRGGGARGGDTSVQSRVTGKYPIIPVIFGFAALIFLVGTVYLVKLAKIKEAILSGIIAAACIGIAVYPEAVALVGLLLVLLAVAWFLAVRYGFFTHESHRAVSEALTEAAPHNAGLLVEKASTLPSDAKIFHQIRYDDRLR